MGPKFPLITDALRHVCSFASGRGAEIQNVVPRRRSQSMHGQESAWILNIK